MSETAATKAGLRRLFTWVPEGLHRRVKAAAAMAGKTQEEYMRELIARALDREEAKDRA